MLAIKCPACGAEGRASKEKIQTRLVCRKCLRVFHVTPSGKTVLGEPPAPGRTATAVSRAKAAPDPGQKVDRLNPPQATRLQPVVRRVSPVGL
ncbi:MAG: hypothetical protein WBC80_23555 [Isosphaeraceae bacterium]